MNVGGDTRVAQCADEDGVVFARECEIRRRGTVVPSSK